MTLISLLMQKAAQFPRRKAIIEASGKAITFDELASQSARMAASLLEKGIGYNSRVLVAIWPGIDLYVTLIALWRVGAIAVFPETATGFKGLCHAARYTAPQALVAARPLRLLRHFMPGLRAISTVLAPDGKNRETISKDFSKKSGGALISFTSGTTGAPKAMQRSHRLLLAQHAALAPVLETGKAQVDLVAFPVLALSCLGYAHTVLLPDWNLKQHDRADIKRICKLAEIFKVTRLIVPPVIVASLVNKNASHLIPGSLGEIITGGGPLFPDIMQSFRTIYPQLALTVLYGSTEAEPISCLCVGKMRAEDWKRALGGGGLPVGEPAKQAAIHIDQSAEIQVAGPHVNESYMDTRLNKETKVLINRRIYHRTGDTGYFDENGRLWLSGRLSMSSDGIYPFVLETQARLQPNIKAAAFIIVNDKFVLAITGDVPDKNSEFFQSMQQKNVILVAVDTIPLDKRHRSKVDYVALKKKITKTFSKLRH